MRAVRTAVWLYIVGSHDTASENNGMMADWVMQVSFVPRMVAVSFENDPHTRVVGVRFAATARF